MSIVPFSKELAQKLFNSNEQFPVNFDLAWMWLEYSKRSNAKRTFLTLGFIEGIDFNLLINEEVRLEGTRSINRNIETISLSCECFKMWGMMAGTPKGKEIRLYFLECERIAKEATRKPTTGEIKQLEIEAQLPAKHKKWVKRYRDLFYYQLEILFGYKKQGYVTANFINKYVYGYFPSEIRERLEQINPLIDGRRQHRQHQHFDDHYLALLQCQIEIVIANMCASTFPHHFEDKMELMGRYKFVEGNLQFQPKMLK